MTALPLISVYRIASLGCMLLSMFALGMSAWSAEDPTATSVLGVPTFVVTAEQWPQLPAIVKAANQTKDAVIILEKGCELGELKARVDPNVRIIDLRYDQGIHIVRGNHPRLEGIWPQYSGLQTGLRDNLVLTDVIAPDAQVTNWQSEPQNYRPTAFTTTAAYHNNHNHCQNFLSEMWSFNPSVNAVAIWGDSGAFVPGAKSWGGFFSARSWPVYWDKYVPENRPAFAEKDFDAQLVGIEVDVLNAGMNAGDPNSKLSKTGVQIVGFGKRNTDALEIRCEDSDAPAGATRKGQFNEAITVYNGLAPDGKVLDGLIEGGAVGVDFSRPVFTDGALKIHSLARGNGIIFNASAGGEIYSESGIDAKDDLVLRAGAGGLKILSQSGALALAVDPNGAVHFGTAMVQDADAGSAVGRMEITLRTQRQEIHILSGLVAVMMLGMVVLFFRQVRRSRTA